MEAVVYLCKMRIGGDEVHERDLGLIAQAMKNIQEQLFVQFEEVISALDVKRIISGLCSLIDPDITTNPMLLALKNKLEGLDLDEPNYELRVLDSLHPLPIEQVIRVLLNEQERIELARNIMKARSFMGLPRWTVCQSTIITWEL